MKTLELISGDQIPALGLGTWKLAGDEARTVVQTAIETGYRHIDCAPIYENESDIGRALEFCLRNGTVDRDDLWITSKLWNDAHRAADVRPALQATLHDLQVDCLDLYLIHWPVVHRPGVVRPDDGNGFLSLDDVPLTETWLALQECQAAGLCRNTGVSNFSVPAIQTLIDETGIVPAVNQVESHPYLAQRPLLEYCRQQQIQMTAYSPLGSVDRPDMMKRDGEPALMTDPVIVRIAERHNVSPAAVLIAWGVGRDTIVIPKSASQHHLQDNLRATDLSLTASDMQAIGALDRGYRFVDGTFWEMPGSPYTVAQLWDE